MTRKHFNVVAKAISEMELTDETRKRIVSELSDTFHSFNFNFDKRKFRRACRPTQSV